MPDREICIALAGLGTVGTAVIRLLQEESARYREEIGVPLRLASLLDRSYQRKDTSWIEPQVRFTDSLKEFLETPSDIVVELIGGTDPADQIITTSLRQRKAVVTANKLLLAKSARRYFQLALEHKAYLGFEAAVAGGIPIIRVLRRALFADRIVRLRGILNGTCNFILSEMAESGCSWQDALKQAQALGYAEADPRLDISGRDAADKLAILSLLAFGKSVDPDQIPTLGISAISPIDFIHTRKLDYTIKLLGVAERAVAGDWSLVAGEKTVARRWSLVAGEKTEDRESFIQNPKSKIQNPAASDQSPATNLMLRVSPFLIHKRVPLSAVSGVLNAVEVMGAKLGSVVFSGRGAGGDPTAVSVVADILNAALWKLGEAPFYLQPFFHRTLPSGEIPNPKSQIRNKSEIQSSNDQNLQTVSDFDIRASDFPEGAEVYPFYIRFFVNDRPGIIAAVASILARWNININSVWQEPWPDHSNLPFVMTVEATLFSTMQKALSELNDLDFNRVPPLALPILDS